MKLGIVGNGYVGQATSLLEGENVEVLIWDTDETKRNIDKFEDLSGCDLVFVCVPTPMNSDGSCYIKIVESVVSDLIKDNIDEAILQAYLNDIKGMFERQLSKEQLKRRTK